MHSHPTDFQGSVIGALREAIERQIPNSRAEVNGGGGHFNIEVTSPVFAGNDMLDSQRLAYGSIIIIMGLGHRRVQSHGLGSGTSFRWE